QSRAPLEDLQHATLEVLALRQPEQDRVVGALSSLRHQLGCPSDIPGGVPEHAAKLLDGQVIRAGAGEQEPAGAEQPHRPEVDLLVAGQASGNRVRAFTNAGGSRMTRSKASRRRSRSLSSSKTLPTRKAQRSARPFRSARAVACLVAAGD